MAEARDLPLPTLLSQALVAFTIAFDNASELGIQHRITRGEAGRRKRGVWLTSQVMWVNFMRFVPPGGTPLRELADAARMTNLSGLERWGYVSVTPDPGDPRSKPPRGDWIVRPKPWGRHAQAVWAPLADAVEARWVARYGADEVGALKTALNALADQLDPRLPAYLPVVTGDLKTAPPSGPPRPVPADVSAALARVLLAFTLVFEEAAPVSLPVAANGLRVLGAAPTPVRDLPRRAGVSKEAVSWILGILSRRGLVVVAPTEGARGQSAALTAAGVATRDACADRCAEVEQAWRARFGTATIDAVRGPLERLQPRLFEGLKPSPTGWRAKLKAPETLPHHPMILHRGGYPDGA
jgi:DNA-binding MarR family transcriptional regulator/HAMP domain-containing protein